MRRLKCAAFAAALGLAACSSSSSSSSSGSTGSTGATAGTGSTTSTSTTSTSGTHGSSGAGGSSGSGSSSTGSTGSGSSGASSGSSGAGSTSGNSGTLSLSPVSEFWRFGNFPDAGVDLGTVEVQLSEQAVTCDQLHADDLDGGNQPVAARTAVLIVLDPASVHANTYPAAELFSVLFAGAAPDGGVATGLVEDPSTDGGGPSIVFDPTSGSVTVGAPSDGESLSGSYQLVQAGEDGGGSLSFSGSFSATSCQKVFNP